VIGTTGRKIEERRWTRGAERGKSRRSRMNRQ
jgi:hypothetical protein